VTNLDHKVLVAPLKRLEKPFNVPLFNMREKLVVNWLHFLLIVFVQFPEDILEVTVFFGLLDWHRQYPFEKLTDFFVGLGFEYDCLRHLKKNEFKFMKSLLEVKR
jgi:hypothetical protein